MKKVENLKLVEHTNTHPMAFEIEEKENELRRNKQILQ